VADQLTANPVLGSNLGVTDHDEALPDVLEIDRMRARWLEEERGSLRDLHDRAAGSGRLPIGLVEGALFG
jgi:hypothetical protein